MCNRYPAFSFTGSSTEYQVITPENSSVLAGYMRDRGLGRLIVTSADDPRCGWNGTGLPDLKDFTFLEELLIYWSNVKKLDGIYSCANLRVLWLDNDDVTEVLFPRFPHLEKVVSWRRRGISSVWDVPTLKVLTLAGLKDDDLRPGCALDSLEKLRILKSSLTDLSLLAGNRQILFLELRGLSKIEDLSQLGSMTQLRHLRIEANRVKDFSFLRGLVNLERLYISSKAGEISVEQLSHLNKLQAVNLSGNVAMQTVNRALRERLQLS